MDLVVLDDSIPHRLAFYLAEEEYLARKYPDRDFFFAWQVEPTVIIGRNQQLTKEVDVMFCRENNVDIVRRKSGGGAVVADMNNIMFSYITSSDDVCTTFSEYTSMVASSLRQLGLNASDNSRNDILIDSRKVSGNSYYHIPGRSIVHGTMLYDYDPVLMGKALSPSQDKLRSHGVVSTHSRVTTIKEHLPELTIGDFLKHVLDTVPRGGEILRLSDEDIAAIEALEKTYYSDSWLIGKNPKGTVHASRRIDGVGELCVDFNVVRGLITNFELTGDYLENGNAAASIRAALDGVPYDRKSVTFYLEGLRVHDLIPNLSSQQLNDLIF